MIIKLSPLVLMAVITMSSLPAANAQSRGTGGTAHGTASGNPIAGSSNTGVGPSGASTTGFGNVAGATGPGAVNPGAVAPAKSAAPTAGVQGAVGGTVK